MGRLFLGATEAGASTLCTNMATDSDPSAPIAPGVLPLSFASAGYFLKASETTEGRDKDQRDPDQPISFYCDARPHSPGKLAVLPASLGRFHLKAVFVNCPRERFLPDSLWKLHYKWYPQCHSLEWSSFPGSSCTAHWGLVWGPGGRRVCWFQAGDCLLLQPLRIRVFKMSLTSSQ